MSRIDDGTRSGPKPLQDHSMLLIGSTPGTSALEKAIRVIDRQLGDDQIGHWEHDLETGGVTDGGFVFVPQPGSGRKIAGWRRGPWPVITDTVNNLNKFNRTDFNPLPIKTDPTWMYPIGEDTYQPDLTWARERPEFHPFWPRIPGGAVGFVTPALNYNDQVPLYLHADPRMPAVNNAGDPRIGALVVDTTREDEIDVERMARLQSVWRVVRPRPPGCVKWDDDLNSIAWQLGRSGIDDIPGYGLCYDTESSPIPPPPPPVPRPTVVVPPPFTGKRGVIGAGGFVAGGPFLVGPFIDQHKIGETEDGEPINSLHLQTESIWLGKGGDAPLKFEDIPYEPAFDGPARVQVHLRHDFLDTHEHVCGTKLGLWKWEVFGVWDIPPPESEPDVETPDSRPFQPRSFQDPHDAYGQTTMGVGMPYMLGRPTNHDETQIDIRYARNATREEVIDVYDRNPITIRMEAYGANDGGDWDYNENPCEGRWRSGTASGGWAIMPPEMDIADVDTSFAPDGITASTTTMVFTPNTQLAWGLPDFATGETIQGYRVASSDVTTGEITWSQVLADGTSPTTRAIWNDAFDFRPDSVYTIQTTIDAAPLILNLQSNGSPSADVRITWSAALVSTWSAGIDNDDSGNWKLSNSAALGTSDAMVFTDATRDVTFSSIGITAAHDAFIINYESKTNAFLATTKGLVLNLDYTAAAGSGPFIRGVDVKVDHNSPNLSILMIGMVIEMSSSAGSASPGNTDGINIIKSFSGGLPTQSRGISVSDMGLSGITTAVGIEIATQANATTNIGIDMNANFMQWDEMTAPNAPAANQARLFVQDNGAGKTQLAVIFNTGAIQILATQP